MLLSGVSDFRSFDMNKVIRMCLIHDLGEAFTGDVPTFEKTSEHTDAELTALDQWVGGFPEAQRREFEGLYAEMKAMETPEARLYTKSRPLYQRRNHPGRAVIITERNLVTGIILKYLISEAPILWPPNAKN